MMHSDLRRLVRSALGLSKKTAPPTHRLRLHELESRVTPSHTATINVVATEFPEGTEIELTSTVTGATTPTYQWAVVKDGGATPIATGTDPNFSFTPDDNGTYDITLLVNDSDGAGGTEGFVVFQSITATNVPPTAFISGPAVSVPGLPLTFTLTATDPSPVDAAAEVRFDIDWNGDGTFDETALGFGAGTIVNHTFAETGTNTVMVRATDKDGGVSAIVSQTVEVETAAVIEDPLNPGSQLLAIGGTAGADQISLTPAGNSRRVKVSVNGEKLGAFGPAQRIAVFGLAGDDNIHMAGSIRIPAWLDGGEGNDRLKSAKGNDVLRGGPGDDDLNGHQGRDVLIGGEGADHMLGGPGDDLLIGGTTSFDADEPSLFEISTIWSGAGTVASRVAALQTSATVALVMDGLNASVFDDGDADVMNGTAGAAWIFGDPTQDGVVGNKKGQFVNDVSVVASQGGGQGKGKAKGHGKP